MRRALALLLVALAPGACGPASVSGTVGGQPVDASDAVAKRSTALNVTSATILIGGETTDLCVDVSAGNRRKGASYLALVVGANGGLYSGTYAIGGIPLLDDRYASAAVSRLDTACNSILDESAGGGSITLDSVEESKISGTFNLAFGADIVQGSFNARLCGWSSLEVNACL